MTVSLTPLSPRAASVGPADDPHKKLWVVLLGGFALTGAWLCLPMMDGSVGSAHVDAAKPPDPSAAQSLDSIDNAGAGAAGGTLNLSMDEATRHKKKDGVGDDMASMLYQAPPDGGAAASGAPLGTASAAASAGNLAQALKDAGKDKNAAGWGGEKAQRGFDAPHLNAGGLSGSGSVSAGAGASAGTSAFGASGAHVGYGSTVGLRDTGGSDAGAGMQALRGAVGSARTAALAANGDAAHSKLSAYFDGTKSNGAKASGPSAGAGASLTGLSTGLDSAPANLKANNQSLDAKKMSDPPAVNVPTAARGNDMAKQMVMMVATAAIGGMIPGVGGQMAMMMGMMLMQQQQANAAAQQSAAQQQAAAQKMGMSH